MNEPWYCPVCQASLPFCDASINSSSTSVGSALMDRCGTGGGVLVNASEALKSCRRVDLEKDDVETVWIELRFQMKEVLCCIVYRPPGANHGKHLQYGFRLILPPLISPTKDQFVSFRLLNV